MGKYNVLAIGRTFPDLSEIANEYKINVERLPSLYPYSYVEYLENSELSFILIHMEQASSFYIKFVSSISQMSTSPKIIMFGKNKIRGSHYCESNNSPFSDESHRLNLHFKAAILSFLDNMYPSAHEVSLPCQEANDIIYKMLLGVTEEEYRQIKNSLSFNLSSGAQYVFVSDSHATQAIAKKYSYLKTIYQRLSDEAILEFQAVLNSFYGGTVIKNGLREIIAIVNSGDPYSKNDSYRIGYDIAVALFNCVDTDSTDCYMLSPTNEPRALAESFAMLPTLKRHRLFFKELRVLGLENYQNKHHYADQEILRANLNIVEQYSSTFNDNLLEKALRTIFIDQLKSSADLTSYYYCASTLNVLYQRFCANFNIDTSDDFIFNSYRGRWIEDICDEYISMFVNAKNLVLQSNLYGNITFYRIKRFIDDHYSQKTTLNHLCERFDVSKSHLCRLFRKNLNTTATSYINKVRISHARRILLSENITIAQLAHQVGFDDPKYFSRVFKSIVGMSPSKYLDSLN